MPPSPTWRSCPRCKSLNLNSTDVGDAGLRALGAMTNLRELGLNYGRFTDKGLEALKTLTGLKRLDLVRTRTAAERPWRRSPRCAIWKS